MTTLILNSELQGGKYTIKKVLGQGGFGITYLAEQAMLDRQVAIKEFFLKDYCVRDEHTCHVTLGTQANKETVDRFLQKFIKEARTISRLHHPGIIEIYDIFMENNTAYYVMEYIEGESLGDIVRSRGALPEKEALHYIRETAEALDYIHSRNILHLDIKPNNLMLRSRDSKIVVIDFGVSKQYDENTNESTTTTPVGISLGYSPAEQYQKNGVSTFSPQSDIYSLGATLYKLLTGVTPPEAIEVARMNGKLQINTSISESTKNAITKALQFHAEDRPQTVLEFLSIIEGKVETTPNVEEDETKQVVDQEKQKAEAMAAERERLMKAAMAKAEKEKAEAESKAREEAVRRAREEGVREVQVYCPSNNNPTIGRVQCISNEDNGDLGCLGRMIRISVFIIGIVVVLTFVVASIILYNDIETRREPQNLPEKPLAKQQSITSPNKNPVQERTTNSVQNSKPTSGYENGHEWVDLGLSVKWATCNVGASSPSDYGRYYAWGEISTKSRYDWNNCYDCLDNTGDRWGTYKLGGSSRILPTSGHDTARENWGGKWRMPTDAENEELCKKCTWTWSTMNGHRGYRVSGKNGNSIFLPAAGYRFSTDLGLVGDFGLYWSSSLSASYSNHARILYFAYDNGDVGGHSTDDKIHRIGQDDNNRRIGQSVRPVTE